MDRRLGRGLDTLLGVSLQTEQTRELSIDQISPNPFQPRKNIDPVALEELRDSIRQHGVLQPILVRQIDRGYQLIAGERRWRAARLAGLDTVPATIRPDVTDDTMVELALVENVQRRDLNPIERALGFRALLERLNVTQEAVAAKVGLRRSTVTNHLRLLDLPAQAQDAVAKGLITMGHARAMLGLSNEAAILALLETAVRRELSVRDIEKAVRDSATAATSSSVNVLEPTRATRARPSWLDSAERRLSAALSTRARVEASTAESGRIVIEYYSQAELSSLLDRLAPTERIA